MAFLVSYSQTPPYDHTRNRAIYLDQRFYELIYGNCRSDSGPFRVLRELASLRYKSPILTVSEQRLQQLAQELTCLELSKASHPQIAEFKKVCQKAVSEGCSLTISADMYPELWRSSNDPDQAL
jgi:hypothetical protein